MLSSLVGRKEGDQETEVREPFGAKIVFWRETEMVTTRSAARRGHNPDSSCSSSSATGIPDPAATPANIEENTPNASPNVPFSCNVCLGRATDPVVTYCGHLFCWPCLYRWVYRHSSSRDCPVCRSPIDVDGYQAAVIPIYCSSYTTATNAPSSGTPNIDVVDHMAPPRPAVRLRWTMAEEILGMTRAIIDRASESLVIVERLLEDISGVASAAGERTAALVAAGREEVRSEPRLTRSRRARDSSDPAPRAALPRRRRNSRS